MGSWVWFVWEMVDTRATTASIGNYRSKPAARVNLGIKAFPCLGRNGALGPKPDNYVSKPINDWLQHVTTQLSRLCICNNEPSKIVYPDYVSKFRGLMSTSLVAANNIANLPIFLTRLESKLLSLPFKKWIVCTLVSWFINLVKTIDISIINLAGWDPPSYKWVSKPINHH